MRAIILAGGKGTRLQPFTINFPKPLMPLGDRPVLEVLMERLVGHGITDITISLGHMAELIKAYFEQRPMWKEKIQLRFVQEDKPLGTAGALSLVPQLDKTFLVMNGDLLTDLNFSELLEFHKKSSSTLTIAAHRREIKIDLGVLEVDGNRRVRGYKEKPISSLEVSMGIYVYEPRALQWIRPGEPLDLPDLVLRLIAAGEPVCAYPSHCQWLDIGRPDDYRQAQELFLALPKTAQTTF
ncbi:MAG: NTP transferase domain-containing protein [Elusimicrobia bacterium]|nr:NTP transferase domain-containing protein [Elusimicrobiota bacterium]